MVIEPYAQEILIGLGIIIIIAIITFVIHLEFRLNRLFLGKNGKNLEEIIVHNASDIERFKQFRKEIEKYLETVEKRMDQSIRGIATVRFNPFRGTGDGGNQSFASSFVNEKGDGVTLSSLYSRDHVSIFAKPVKSFKSEYDLTEEEKESIEKAKEKLKI